MSAVVLSVLSLVVALLAFSRAAADYLFSSRRIDQLQNQLLKTQKELKHRGELANEIAHDIKNPITAILCSAETMDLLIGEELDPLHRQSLHYIKEYGDSLLRLVSDFLDVSRAEAGNITPRPEEVEVAPLVESIAGLLQAGAHKKGISLKQYSPKEGLCAVIDPVHFKQVIFNLVHNAIKFTPEGGTIQIYVKDDFPREMLEISIVDNGSGIDPEKLPNIFNPYAKYNGEEGAESAGTGLGLALCKMLIEMAGGKISVQSEPGVGSEFLIAIPAVDRAEDIIEELDQDIATHQPLVGQNFLVIDEDVGSREAISRLIEAWGGAVDRVAMAVDAVEALGAKEYDAIMIDDSLDGVYGYELARMLRDGAGGDNTTIIVTTREPVDEKVAENSGADKCIEKPLNGKKLLSSLIRSGKFNVAH